MNQTHAIMSRRPYDLPSLSMLATFEAAARAQSFKVAAAELGVTAGAVSHQIKALEADLGFVLFSRTHRSVHLTSEGKVLFESCMRGFSDIGHALRVLRADQNAGQISIGATTAVSSLWLTPQVTKFWRKHGDVTIIQEVRDRPFRRPIELDFVIEYALNRPEDASDLLFGDELIPLAAPSFSTRIEDLEKLAQAPLIHLDAKETNWTSWPKWFESLGYSGSITATHRVNNYSIALQLAQDGLGIVLGWKRLVAPLLAAGKLEEVSTFSIKAPGSFYLVSNSSNQTRERKLVQNWLTSSVE